MRLASKDYANQASSQMKQQTKNKSAEKAYGKKGQNRTKSLSGKRPMPDQQDGEKDIGQRAYGRKHQDWKKTPPNKRRITRVAAQTHLSEKRLRSVERPMEKQEQCGRTSTLERRPISFEKKLTERMEPLNRTSPREPKSVEKACCGWATNRKKYAYGKSEPCFQARADA